ncbi:Ribosomal RNA small subunit methyltransferase C [Vibrio stylophorae]|uniref:Ribosomal RNA small subunit methyltransferase C n=1 Tax=Vibrio stylophorae TaxID=659351 RepID=A0ABN8DQ47_9VIBR|nr:16S rRNA (guanine(1207)-N(2))-methyltransferase RsmC [Vibrio stylophorae]CAH0532583.1 Ribosomal RNA small subunit methyltransferase C [Vibrio stylophorae]
MSAFIPASEILERQLAYVADQHLLIAGEFSDDFALTLAQHSLSVSVFCTHFGHYQRLSQYPSLQCFFGTRIPAEIKPTQVILYWPKAKAEAEMLFAMLMHHCGAGTEVIVVGENRSGVKSAEKMFAPYGKLTKFDSARRCSFYFGLCEQAPTEFNLNDWFKQYTVTLGEQQISVQSLPGVFSHGSLDVGTALLLNHLPNLQGRILDFGCGAGVIATLMKQRYPTIDLVAADVSAWAVASTQATLAANGLEGDVRATDVYSTFDKNTDAEKFDAIISNPPFHAGLKTFYRASEQLIEQAPKYLTAQGQLLIVANSFLQYPPVYQASFGQCTTVAEGKGFRVYSNLSAE